jgi:gamma-glutamyltranspeptidase/glutathione hydrolase
MIVNVLDHGRSIADAANMARIHHQWFPDNLQVESIHSPDTIKILQERGHNVVNVQSTYTSLQSVAVKDGLFQGVSDPRRPDSAAVAPANIRAVGD